MPYKALRSVIRRLMAYMMKYTKTALKRLYGAYRVLQGHYRAKGTAKEKPTPSA
nr:MAG TPA: hypothetical protein [Caudoviricetes sp.]